MIFYLFYYILSTQKWKKLYPKSWGARVKKKDIMIPTAERPILQCGWTTTINVINICILYNVRYIMGKKGGSETG